MDDRSSHDHLYEIQFKRLMKCKNSLLDDNLHQNSKSFNFLTYILYLKINITYTIIKQ